MKYFQSINSLLALLFFASTLFSCQKKEAEPLVTQQEVIFSAIEVNPSGFLKSTEEWECKNLSADYAKILIDGNTYFTEVYRVNGVLYTQAIKLDVPPGGGSKTYEVSGFFLMHDGGNKGDYEDNEEIVMATPSNDGPYKEYVAEPVTMEITVNAFEKIEVPIDVLCFQENLYDGFGFDWFVINEIVIREQCFFGDICMNGDPYLPADFAGSAYENQANGLQEDMPAIFEIRAYLGGNPIEGSPFSNLEWHGEGAPLCIEYADDLNVTGEEFTFELWVLVKNTAGTFSYQLYHTWTFEDDQLITSGQDGIVDFVIGDCSYIPANITFNWLPAPPPQP